MQLQPIAWFYYFFTILVGFNVCNSEHVAHMQVEQSDICTLDDLNHSVLVECNESGCKNSHNGITWPISSDKILHVYSTRDGERFSQSTLQNLDYNEPHTERDLNINTTIYINPKKTFNASSGKFGATLDTTSLLTSVADGTFEKNFKPIFRDLFGESYSEAHLTYLRLPLELDHVIDCQNIINLIEQIDRTVDAIISKSVIRIIFDFHKFNDTYQLSQALLRLSKAIQFSGFEREKNSCQLAIGHSDWSVDDIKGAVKSAQELLSWPVLAYSTITEAQLLKHINIELGGFLIKSKISTSYLNLESLGLSKSANSNEKQKELLSIGVDRLKPTDYGDWQNGQNLAAEIISLIKHGSNTIIDEQTVSDVFKGGQLDAPIYSLRASHELHFRGPMYYALAHFSHFLFDNPQSIDELAVSTQPNMFAAKYSAFQVGTQHRHIVSVVLNDNEHLLPFRLAVGDKIVLHTNLNPKSFNTFVIKFPF